MIEFLLADFNLPYAIAIAFVILLALIEGLGLIIGLSLMNVLDQFTAIDIDAEVDVSSGGLTSVLGWLCINKMPLLVWLVLISSSFGISGYTLNYIQLLSINLILPTYITLISAIILAIYLTKIFSKPLVKILPKNESSAQSNTSFIGLVGKITIGKASFENPAEAMIYDSFNQKHYLMVAPESEQEVFIEGSEVVLLEKLENYWLATALTN